MTGVKHDPLSMLLAPSRPSVVVVRNKAAAMCEACDEGIVTVATCLSGNQKLCEMCDLAEWAAGLCSSCGNMPATRDQPLCSAQLCDVCDLSLWVIQNGFM